MNCRNPRKSISVESSNEMGKSIGIKIKITFAVFSNMYPDYHYTNFVVCEARQNINTILGHRPNYSPKLLIHNCNQSQLTDTSGVNEVFKGILKTFQENLFAKQCKIWSSVAVQLINKTLLETFE